MSATFPFVDPFIRLENALWGVFHCRGNKSVVVLTNLWEIWSLQPTLHRQAITLRRALLKVVVLRILRAVNLRCLPIGYLHTLLQFLHSIISGNVLLQHFTKKGSSMQPAQSTRSSTDSASSHPAGSFA
ncbi:hypothetical protein PC129_g10337 [Phytophthora cactorum]|uniref:Uncharacterized protein n=1 Tax=Phytophthora cactorum TaxID=29920 RepID=A0A8T1C700_9STRA|nr:hypothetical protein Pcac1_g17421 [Phytophthora cactorum]KAG2815951.1 hypothetical protein PC111_g13350 [Phytophthora cactorum]KAG2823369.1 hypothetical protein PC112_g10546 [Phytophthora cactorum]KAG2856961.1 hypothetical protein PC113_g11105 [Phytophthora cactorum]KAG2901737.1 hypothetical protein PC114_g13056 [Phytophthora cactorum]